MPFVLAQVQGRDVAPGQPGLLGAQLWAVVFDDEYIVAAALVQVDGVAVLGVQGILWGGAGYADLLPGGVVGRGVPGSRSA
jgi:hypothetical protein